MMRRKAAVLVTLAAGCALALLAACPASAQEGGTDLFNLRREIDQLTSHIAAARQDLYVVQRTQARTMATVEDMQRTVQTVDAKMEEVNHRLRELAQRLDALQATLAQSMVARQAAPAQKPETAEKPAEPMAAEAAPAPPTVAPQAPEAPAEEAQAPAAPEPKMVAGPLEKPEPAEAPKAGPELPPSKAAPPPLQGVPLPSQSVEVAILDPGEIFRTAYEDYVKGNYDLAILGFQDYLEKYPGTELASNAQYWLADSYMSKEDYGRAAEEYQRLLDGYPKSPKVSSALFKQGVAFLEMGEASKAKEALEAVVSAYPESAEAAQATEKLKSLPAEVR